MAKAPTARAKPEAAQPVRLVAIHGFVDDYGDRWHWDCGQIVRNPFVIAMLRERGAPVEEIEA
ncbi:MAG TPA: hypothetical protein VMH92_05685 [Acidocella sp.]|nr:hypothetical protein [Acidocella sp.]